MKNKTSWNFGIIIAIAIGILVAINPFKKDIWDVNADKLIDSFDIISGDTIIDDLSQWIPFEWDELYGFAPYTSNDQIYEVIGYKWDLISATVDESMNQIVFLKDGKVVCYLYGYPENVGLGFDFGEYEGEYIKLESTEKLAFETAMSDIGVRYFKYIE